MKELDIIKISGLENMDAQELNTAMELHAQKHIINEVNWAKDFPYCPNTTFSIARTDDSLIILYNVRGLDLRAQELETNGHMWEDSCCEFFVEDPSGDKYYNFEMNCLGFLLNGIGAGRENREIRPLEEMERITTFSSLLNNDDEVEPIEIENEIFAWTVGMIIPMDMIGIDPNNLPKSLRGNFYKCGDKTAHTHFVSWNKIDIEKPDFHRPDFFGKLNIK